MISRQIVAVILGMACLAGVALAAEEYTVGQEFSDTLRSGGSGPRMVVIPGGRFVLGGWPVGTADLGLVKFDYRLGFGVTEVTLGQYRQFLKSTRSGNLKKLPKGSDDLPVTNVSWDDAEAYVSWLSRETGHYYHLPSASEWEYAARAGTTTNYFWGDAVGENRANCLNCKTTYDGKLAPVGTFPANGWGLYDMHGNVWEWTKDCIDPNSAPPADGSPQLFGNCESRELRGGSAQADAWSVRASARAFAQRKMRDDDVGFRVVMDIP
jgi:formylglycine-generating enzyme required for sulfatase activity